MPATDFTFYNAAKEALGEGGIDFSTATLRMKLCDSTSNAETLSVADFASITGEIAATGGYTAGGLLLSGVTWGAGSSPEQMRLDANDVSIEATGGDITDVMYAVIGIPGGPALCFSQLNDTEFTVTEGNTLAVQFSADGIATLD